MCLWIQPISWRMVVVQLAREPALVRAIMAGDREEVGVSWLAEWLTS